MHNILRFRSAVLLVLFVLVPGSPAEAQDDVFRLDGLVVTGSPLPREDSEVAGYLTVLDGDELRLHNLTTVGEALRGVPSVDVVRNGSFGATTSVFMRGGESDYVLVLLDGVQVNQPGGSFDFASLTLHNVERIEVLRGPASALYGSDAVAGVIHVITRAGAQGLRGEVSTRVGSFGRKDWSAQLSGGTDRAGYSLSLARLETDGILAFNNQHSNTVLNGRARFAPGGATRADVTFRVGDRVYHFPTDGSGNVVDQNAFTFGDEAMIGLSVRNELTRSLSFEARVGVTGTDGGSSDEADSPSDSLGFFGFTSLDHVRRATADIRMHWRADAATVTAGWEFEEERARSFTESLSQYGSSSGRSNNARLNRGYFAHVSGTQGAIAFNAGGRLEDNERFGSSGTWQLGVSWQVPALSQVRLRASAGRAIKEPTFFETFATGFATGNPSLEPEKSRSWEVGSDVRMFDGLVGLRTTWFDQSFEDLIQYTFTPLVTGGPNYYNVAEATSRGLEVEATVRSGAISGSASWTWLDTDVVDSGFDSGAGATFVAGEPLLRRAAHTLRASLRSRVGSRLTAFTDIAVVGERADRDFSTFPATPVVLPRYTDVRMGFSTVVVESSEGRAGLTLDLRVDNVLDRAVQEVFGFRAPGRGFYLGGAVTFGAR